MPRKKKRAARSTRQFIAPEPSPPVLTDPIENTTPAPEVKSDKLTLDEAIKSFRENPREEEFWCPDKKGFAIAFGDRYIKFKEHKFRTSDPVEVELLMRSREFNLFIFAISPILRNLSK